MSLSGSYVLKKTVLSHLRNSCVSHEFSGISLRSKYYIIIQHFICCKYELFSLTVFLFTDENEMFNIVSHSGCIVSLTSKLHVHYLIF